MTGNDGNDPFPHFYVHNMNRFMLNPSEIIVAGHC